MKVCGFCDCLVQREESTCPFCDAVLRDAAAPAAVTVVGLAAALGACGPVVDNGAAEESGGSSSQTGPMDPISTSITTSTSSPTSTSTTTSSSTLPPTSVGSSSGTDETTGAGFIKDPDGGAAAYGECDVWTQNDCPDGEKCLPWANDGGMAWNATRCSPIADEPGAPGDPCTVEDSPWSGIDDCDITSMCFLADAETNLGTCVSFCQGTTGDPVCPDADDSCLISNDGVIALCLDRCDPVTQDCAVGLNCVAGNDDFVCVAPGAVEFGGDCVQPMDCGPGLSCVDGAFADCDVACCTEPCDPDSPTCSDLEHECAPLGEAGVCVPA